MDNKKIVITGASRGIGLEMARILISKGHTVFGAVRNPDGANDLHAAEPAGVLKLDISHQDSINSFSEELSTITDSLDILVNNAGITRDSTIKKMSIDQWQDVINVNLNSVFNMTKVCWDEMTSKHFGRIINISSVNGQAGQYGQVNYCAAKAGIIGMTKAIAQEGARYNITANTVAPGYVDTEMVAAVPQNVLDKIISTIPVGRLGHPQEIARAVAFLAREDSQFVTGSTISINGGHHMY